jgi:pimeloyl-ACP methyl ester carboxylesterase
MTHFVFNLMTFLEKTNQESPLVDAAFLVVNLPGQPFTIYDQHKPLTLAVMEDIYDRLIFRSLEATEEGLGDIEISFVGFGLGSLIATQLALDFGDMVSPIKRFMSFNGIFSIDERIRKAYQELSDSLHEANESAHPKLLDIANSCKFGSFRLESGPR